MGDSPSDQHDEHQRCVQCQGSESAWCSPHHLWHRRPLRRDWLFGHCRSRFQTAWTNHSTFSWHRVLDLCFLLHLRRSCHWRSTKREQVPGGGHHGDVHHLCCLCWHPPHHIRPMVLCYRLQLQQRLQQQ